MTWTRLGDDFNDRPDHLDCSRSARLLHVEALVYCNKHLTNGRIPFNALPRISDSEDIGADLKELADAGIWEATEDGKAWLLDWSDQEPADDVKARQRRQADKQKRYRRRKELHADGDHSECDPRFCKKAVTGNATRNATSNETGVVTPSRPVPSRPLGRDRDRGAGPDLPSGRPALPDREELRCSHGYPNGLAWTSRGSFLMCQECNQLVHKYFGTTEVLLERAKTGLGYTDAEKAAMRSSDPTGIQVACELADSVYRRSFPDEDPDEWDLELCDSLTALIYFNVNPEQAKLHEYVDDKGDCSRCNLPQGNPIHVHAERNQT